MKRTLQKVGRPPPHAAVDVCLASLDVIVEVIPESLDMRDDLFSSLGRKMSWEEHYASSANLMTIINVKKSAKATHQK